MGGAEPVVIDGPAGKLHVRGRIDRLDRAGDAIIVIDYKSGGNQFKPEDLLEGRSLQMLVYIQAAERLLAQRGERAQVAGGAYWHISTRKTSGEVVAQSEVLDTARDNLHYRVERAGRGVCRHAEQADGWREVRVHLLRLSDDVPPDTLRPPQAV